MNSIISGGLNKGESGVSSSFSGPTLPAGQGLGPEGTDPLSALNHPSSQLAGTVLRIRE